MSGTEDRFANRYDYAASINLASSTHFKYSAVACCKSTWRIASETSNPSSFARSPSALVTCSSMLCDLSSCDAMAATAEQTAADAHRIRHDGDVRWSMCVSHAVNGCPPIAGAAVKAAERLPPKIEVL